MSISQHRKVCLRLSATRDQKGGTAFNGIRYDFAFEAHVDQQRRKLLGKVGGQHWNFSRFLTFRWNGDSTLQGGLKLSLIKIGGG